MNEESLVTISEASRILGVSEPALRQWTDEGRIKAFITPGGHRRYSRGDLKKFLSTNQRLTSIKELVTGLEDSAPAHRNVAQQFLSDASWMSTISGAPQEHLAIVSRHFLKLIIKYVTMPSDRDETMKQAQDAGFDFGQTLASLGLPLTHSVQAFIMHRELIITVVTNLMKKKGATEKAASAIPLVNHILDQALISLVQAHQLYRNQPLPSGGEELGDINNTPAV